MLPETISAFVERFSRLPAIGPRLATRLAFYIISLDASTQSALADALKHLSALGRCERCFFVTDGGAKRCTTCSNASRDTRTVAIVERETDAIALERSGSYKGTYFLIGELPERGVLQPLQKLRLEHLKKNIADTPEQKLSELIIALNLNTFGDFVTGLIRVDFKDRAEKITRIGRGIPTGGEIEFADEETIASALERRN